MGIPGWHDYIFIMIAIVGVTFFIISIMARRRFNYCREVHVITIPGKFNPEAMEWIIEQFESVYKWERGSDFFMIQADDNLYIFTNKNIQGLGDIKTILPDMVENRNDPTTLELKV